MIDHLKFYFNRRIFKRCVAILIIVLLLMFCYVALYSEHDLLQQTNKGNNLLNFKSFYYVIPSKICPDNLFLLILIHSAPNHFQHRNLIRSTWGSPNFKIPTVKVIFLLALSPEFQDAIEKENYHHKDIVQGNFIDSYHNLTYKHVMGLKWASENCADVNYLMKMDDDIFVDIYQFSEYIQEYLTSSKLRNKIACFVQSGMPVVRDPVSKWYVSKNEYFPDIFETYCSGWAYLTTTNVAHLLFETVQRLNYFWVDDVHVTGTTAKLANVTHIKINVLYDLESDGLVDWSNTEDDFRWNKMFAPTWGDLVLSRKAYKKTLKCWLVKCKCCYNRKTTPHTTKPSTTRKEGSSLVLFVCFIIAVALLMLVPSLL